MRKNMNLSGQKQFRNLSVRYKFLLPALVFVIAGFSISTFFAYKSSKNALNTAVQAQLKMIADSKTEYLDSWIHRAELDFNAWTENKAFINSTQDTFIGRAARKSSNRQLAELLKAYKYYDSLNIADSNGC